MPMPVHAVAQSPTLATSYTLGTPTSVASTTAYRVVFGSANLQASAGSAATIRVTIDGTTVMEASQPAADTTLRRVPFTFVVAGGSSYTISAVGGGTTETLQTYSFQDF